MFLAALLSLDERSKCGKAPSVGTILLGKGSGSGTSADEVARYFYHQAMAYATEDLDLVNNRRWRLVAL